MEHQYGSYKQRFIPNPAICVLLIISSSAKLDSPGNKTAGWIAASHVYIYIYMYKQKLSSVSLFVFQQFSQKFDKTEIDQVNMYIKCK